MTNTPDETKQTQDGGQPSNEPGYITREQFEAYQQEVNDTIAKGFKAVQSKSDQYQSAFQNALKALGGQPPSQEQTTEPGTAPPSEQKGDKSEAEAEAYNNAINAVAQGMIDTFGFEVEEEDPEAEIVKKVLDAENPYDFLEGMRQALTAKKERLDGEGGKKEVNPARIPGLASGSPSSNPIENITDPAVLLKQGLYKE